MKRQISEGIFVETVCEDAMSKRETLLVTFPGFGPFPTPDAVLGALIQEQGGEPRTIKTAKEVIRFALQSDTSALLSDAGFLAQAQRQIDQAEEAILQLPPEYHAAMIAALDCAFRAGVAVSTAEMRTKFLRDVTVQAKMKVAQRAGGEKRKGKIKPDSEAHVDFMHGKI